MSIDAPQLPPQAEAASLHPLEPLSAEEIAEAVTIVREEKELQPCMRFVSVALNEPPKSFVLSFEPGMPFSREAFMILLDNSDGGCYESVVSITEKRVASWKLIPGVQPNIMLDEFEECEAAVKASPEFQAVLARRGSPTSAL
ncbi:hypothetical protein LJK88_31485 [Paenibacillus sp. P26]|nr:hypothetical protein LJK88_31485 [Paenibacillus sp. P26]